MNLLERIHFQSAHIPVLRQVVAQLVARKIQKFEFLEKERRLKDPQNLRNFEDKVFSQNGEDGIINEIFERIGCTNKFFVEFGIENGKECNSRQLLVNKCWKGVWIEGSEEMAEQAEKEFAKYPIEILRSFITRENINDLFEQAQVPKEFDLLSIDIDGNDYWIWKALKLYRPRVVAIEYNAKYLPQEKWIMDYNPTHTSDGSCYFGASLDALKDLGEEKQYTLVACDSQGVNAFFVRSDLVGSWFPDTGKEVEYFYCAPKYRNLFFGHPPR